MRGVTARSRTLLHRLAVLLALSLLAAACGSSPTEEAAPPAEDDPGASEPASSGSRGGDGDPAADPFEPVLAELEGLEGQARTDRLVELAQEEGGLNVYTSNTDFADMAKVFTDTYDIDVSVYRARSNQVLQRLLQEAEAGYTGADLVDNTAEEMASANAEGLLRDYEGPAAEGLMDAATQAGWVGSYLSVFTVSWNTEVVTQPPTSYADLADERFAGLVMVEPREYAWFMTLSDYLVSEEGMTQDEVDELFRQIGANATQVTGNTVHANFLASGEYGVSASVYSHLVDRLIDTGVPISRTPPVEPIAIRPAGIGLLRSAQHPASALLLMEWMLTDGQQLIADVDRVPARIANQGGKLDGVRTIPVDLEKVLAEGPEWEDRYEQVLREAQQLPAS